MMKKLIVAAALLTTLAAAGGCGSSDEPAAAPADAETTPTAVVRDFTDEELWKFLGAKVDNRFGEGDWTVTLADGQRCDLDHDSILRTPDDLDFYADVYADDPDPMIKNGDGWMGLIVSSYDGATQACTAELTKRLADFK